MILSLIGEHLPAALLHAELLNPTVTDDANLFSFQLFPEKIKDGRCLSAIGIQVAVFLRQIKTSFLKKADRIGCLETRKELRQPVRVVASVIPLRRKISIAEVALSVSFIEVFAAAIAAIMPDAPPPIMPICLITDFKSSLQPFGKRQNCNYHTTSRFETQGIFPALLWKRRASRSKSAV